MRLLLSRPNTSNLTEEKESVFSTEDSIRRFLSVEDVYNAKLKAIEIHMMNRPSYRVVDGKVVKVSSKSGAYFTWFHTIADLATHQAYYKAIDDKYELVVNKQMS